MSEDTVAAETPQDTGEPTGQLDGINPSFKEKAETEPKEDTAAEKAVAALKKLKVKGKEIEVDDAQYHSYAQKGAAATQTWEEAAKMRKDAENFVHLLKTDPLKILKDPNLGLDFRKIAEDYLWEQLQDEQMSPEQKAQRDQQRELEKYRKAEQDRRAKEDGDRQKELHSKYAQDYDKRISAALATSGLPKTTGTVRRMVEYMSHDVKLGLSRDPSDYVDMVREDYMRDIQELFGSTDGDTMLKFLGEEGSKKIRASDLKRLKTTTPTEGHTFVPGKGMVKAQHKKLSGQDWERSIMREFKGR